MAKAKPRRRLKAARRKGPFLQISHEAIKVGGEVLRSTEQMLVWLYIHHRVWADKAHAVVIAYKTLEAWGVGRKAKYAALRNLEMAGLIQVKWRERKSPLVSLVSGDWL